MTFLQEAKKRGKTKQQAAEAMKVYRQKFGAFDDDAQAVEQLATPIPIKTEPPQPQTSINPAMSGAPSYAQQTKPEDFAIGRAALQPVRHPLQFAKGISIGALSTMAGTAPSYVTIGSPGYVDPMKASQVSQDVTGMAKTTAEKIGVPIGQMVATMGAPAEGKAIRSASKAIPEAIAARSAQQAINAAPKELKIIPIKLEKIIPDVDEVVKETVSAPKVVTAKTVKELAGKAPRTGFASRIEPRTATMINEPLTQFDTPLTTYAVKAREAVKDPRSMTPLDLAATKATKALGEINKIKSDIGNKMSELIEPIQKAHYSEGILLGTKDIKSEWNNAVSKYMGANIDETGKMVAAEGRVITDPAESSLFKQINTMITNLPEGATIQELADAKTAIRRLTDNYKASFAQPVNSTAEVAGKVVNRLLDEKIMKVAGPEYKQMSREYANISKIQEQLNRRLGEITDKETGTTRTGASLLKSALNATGDRGAKALFESVKKVTGYDLIKDAAFAEATMKAVGDERIFNLLREAGEANEALKTIASGGMLEKGLKVAEIGVNKIRGDKLDELVNYFNKVHGKSSGVPISSLKGK